MTIAINNTWYVYDIINGEPQIISIHQGGINRSMSFALTLAFYIYFEE